jgi:osomolarity two-component system, sensor histidine kinase NIK1
VCSIAEVTKAIAGGDLTKINVDMREEMLELKEMVNGMKETLSVFADELTRVTRKLGTEGKVGGMWKDLTDNFNVMAAKVSPYVEFWLRARSDMILFCS